MTKPSRALKKSIAFNSSFSLSSDWRFVSFSSDRPIRIIDRTERTCLAVFSQQNAKQSSAALAEFPPPWEVCAKTAATNGAPAQAPPQDAVLRRRLPNESRNAKDAAERGSCLRSAAQRGPAGAVSVAQKHQFDLEMS